MFSPEPEAGPGVRWFVRSVLRGHDVDPDVGELLASELASNAIRHGRTPFTVRVDVGPVVRIEVQDGNSVVPTLQAAKGDDDAGRGLMLLEALADRWGVDRVDGGKLVWFEYTARSLAQR